MAGNLPQCVLADDGEDDAGRAHILLGATVDEGVLAHVNGTGHDVGRHVGDEGAGAVHVLLDLRTIDGIVGGDVQVIEVCGNLKALGNVAVVLVLGAGDGVGIADALGLHESLVGPYAGIQVGGLLLQIVHGHIEELQGGAAAQEYNLVGVRNVEEFLPQGTAFVHDGVPLLGTVGDGKNGDAGAAEVLQGCNGVIDGYLGEQAGAGIENMNFFGHDRNGFKILS